MLELDPPPSRLWAQPIGLKFMHVGQRLACPTLLWTISCFKIQEPTLTEEEGGVNKAFNINTAKRGGGEESPFQ